MNKQITFNVHSAATNARIQHAYEWLLTPTVTPAEHFAGYTGAIVQWQGMEGVVTKFAFNPYSLSQSWNDIWCYVEFAGCAAWVACSECIEVVK